MVPATAALDGVIVTLIPASAAIAYLWEMTWLIVAWTAVSFVHVLPPPEPVGAVVYAVEPTRAVCWIRSRSFACTVAGMAMVAFPVPVHVTAVASVRYDPVGPIVYC